MYKSCDDSDSSDDEAEMRRIAKQLTRKIPRRSRQTANAGAGPRSSVVARVSGSSGDYSSEDEYSTPTVQADADYGGRTVQSSKESDSATEMKSDSVAETNWSVALTSGAMDSLIQALQDDIGKTVCSFESKRENNLRQPANACASHRYGNANGPSCTSPENSKHLPLYPPAVKKFNAHPRRFDVLFGLHKTLREHTGNVHADNLVASYRPKYDKADKPEKTAIASHIIKIIRESYDGRFMKFEGNEGWVEVEPGVAREKIIHSFRKSRAHTIRNHRTETSTEGIEMQKLLSQLLHLSPTTGGVVPTSVASASTFPEFLCQLTKMLSDSNREVIEWSHGESKLIVIPAPMTFRAFVIPTLNFLNHRQERSAQSPQAADPRAK
jgi:hypothetical protein